MDPSPSYRTIILHLAEVSAMNYKNLPEGVIRHYGTCMLYQIFLACALVAEKPGSLVEDRHIRWLRLYNGKIGIRFGPQNFYAPNNGRGVVQLLANCLEFDPILRAFVFEPHAMAIIESGGVISDGSETMLFINQPPAWLGVNDNPWVRLDEAGAEMDRRTLSPEVYSAESEYAMQRRVLINMFDLYEPKG